MLLEKISMVLEQNKIEKKWENMKQGNFAVRELLVKQLKDETCNLRNERGKSGVGYR